MITKKDKIEAIKFFNHGIKKSMNPMKLFLRFFNLWDEKKDQMNDEYYKLLEGIEKESSKGNKGVLK